MIERYRTKAIASIFDEERKLKKWLFVERVVAEVEEQAGIIPRGLSRKIARVSVTPSQVEEIEKVTNHDVIAFLQAAREQLGERGKWLHFGLTSYDLVDTAFVLSILDALTIVTSDMVKLQRILNKLAKRHIRTPQMGRTHGVFAQPITFGYKVASWREEIKRALARCGEARREMSYGKLSGAVGTYTMLSPAIERKVMKKLGLRAEPISTQVLPRDRFTFLLSVLTMYACALERIATEIRNLSRTEIGEVLEPFGKKQKGSSAMPHKKNPIICERVCGLARVLRGFLIPAYENITLWHERDITNSSVERIIIPDSFHLVHYMTLKMIDVLGRLTVNVKRMRENIEGSYGVYASQNLMNALIENGMSRDEAYRIVQKLSFQCVADRIHLREAAATNNRIKKFLSSRDISRIFDLQWYVRHIIRKKI